MKKYNIYGFGFDKKIINNRFFETKPSSKNIGKIALNNYKNLAENNLNKIRPLFLSMEK